MGIGILNPWPEWVNRLVRRYHAWRDRDERAEVVAYLREYGESSAMSIYEYTAVERRIVEAMAEEGLLTRRYKHFHPRWDRYSLPPSATVPPGETR